MVKGQFLSLFRINTATVTAVLIISIPTEMEPSFISEKLKVLDQEHRNLFAAKKQLQKCDILS
jgi:hypothetical protein